MAEMAIAIAGLKNGNGPGGDGILAELWKHGGDNLFCRLPQLITNAWEGGSVPQPRKDASIVTIYKKGDRTNCGNYRGISIYFHSKQDLRQDPPQQTIYSLNTRGSSGDTISLLR